MVRRMAVPAGLKRQSQIDCSVVIMLVDSHCHLDFPDFAQDRDAVVARAVGAGVGKMVTICTRVRRFPQVLEIAEECKEVWCSVGTHPHNADEEQDVTAEELIALSQNERVVAIGEAGLDFHYDKSSRMAQAASFRTHIKASRATGLPLVIHAREADAEIEAILRDEAGKGAFPFVLHCFSSGRRLAEAGIELGGYVSFSGILTFRNSGQIRDIAAELPLDRLLVETDAPYLAPPPHRGKRNEPAFVVETAKVLSEILGAEPEAIATATTENFHRLFSKVPRSSNG
jgi:TatD DNase family protein